MGKQFRKKRKFSEPCDFCGKEAYYRFKTGKRSYCCQDNVMKCPGMKAKKSKENHPFYNKKRPEFSKWLKENGHPMTGRTHTEEVCKAQSERMKGDLNPSKNPEIAAKISKKMKEKQNSKGYKWTEEQRKIASIAQKKSCSRLMIRKQRSENMKGKQYSKGYKHTDEERKRRAIRMEGNQFGKGNKGPKGYRHSDEQKLIWSIERSGPNNVNWQGGKSFEEYCVIWVDKEYKEDILCRDDHQCQNPHCWGNTDILNRHHIDYDKKNCHPYNIITLCVSCNSRANYNRDYWQEFYQNIITERHRGELVR